MWKVHLPINQSNSLSKITPKCANFDHSVPKSCLNFFTSNQNLNLLAHFFSYPTDKLCIMPNVAQVAKYCPKDAQILPKDFV